MDHDDSPKPTSFRLGTLLAGAAILVQAPRLVLTILAADRLPVSQQTEQVLLTVSAVGTAIAVTGGGIYIAHAALTAQRWRGFLGAAWLLVLTASAGLVAPAVAAKLANQELHHVVNSPLLRAAWAVLATLAHELTAAGCMLAAASASRFHDPQEIELRLYAERDQAFERAQLAQQRLDLAEARAIHAEQRAEQAELELQSFFETELEIPDDEILRQHRTEPETFPCEDCGRDNFKTKQARAAHRRSCPKRNVSLPPSQGEP